MGKVFDKSCAIFVENDCNFHSLVNFAFLASEKISHFIQGDPNQNPLFQMALPLRQSISDPMLVKPKLV